MNTYMICGCSKNLGCHCCGHAATSKSSDGINCTECDKVLADSKRNNPWMFCKQPNCYNLNQHGRKNCHLH